MQKSVHNLFRQLCDQTSGLAIAILLLTAGWWLPSAWLNVLTIGGGLLLGGFCFWLFRYRSVFCLSNLIFFALLVQFGVAGSIFDVPGHFKSDELFFLFLLALNFVLAYRFRFRTVFWFLRRCSVSNMVRNQIGNFYRLAYILLYLIPIYVAFLIIVNRSFGGIDSGFVRIANGVLIVGVLFLLWLYEVIRIVLVYKRLKKEIWYPIIDDKGKVIGWIERRESFRNRNRYLHPAIRFVVIAGGRIYLAPAPSDAVIPNRIDTPAVTDMRFGEDASATIRRLLARDRIVPERPPVFMLKRHFRSERFDRMFYTYFVVVSEERADEIDLPTSGKFWSVQQIRDNLDRELFCPVFEEEFTYLDAVVLPTLTP